ncbi:sigma-54-dependent Fis family transcriptional regulator [Enterovibrio norvegicus FF-454]|uniref:Sigma-54-dependent Fis family transcriptional regulator n=1 Tax=Enterovibrio norvegicus FF-454 TaxID=1185651 RepID=A0A1E5C5T0_9GAMM|nr:sigma-54 dependent transcriptional regulator [Enterovibrio norvegicus]OEE60860.1 sigma-54-dependent Fis family transcriptional regulator [Enterovibrio norvegicus FF-454]
MKSTYRVLIIEDSEPLSNLYMQYLANEPIELTCLGTGQAALDHLQVSTPHLILLDLKLPDMSGEKILQWINEQAIPCAVIVVTSHGSVNTAVDLMRQGAVDFLEKPVSAERLKTTIRNQLERTRLQGLVEDIQSNFERNTYQGFIGSSLPMQNVYRIIDAAAPSKATVFITGESGTGKEVCAEAIHHQSPRTNAPFIALNCGAIPHDLMESEIFGHIKGAFTGASNDRKGAASQAEGGTLFLDEICEMDLELQKKLLRFIQTGRFQKVGASKEESADIRFLCATNRDPLQEVSAGRFREDLYYRLHVVPLAMPPLRERGDDILSIATSFLVTYAQEEGKKFSRFTPEAEVVLRHYPWPGNVRQLQNVIRNVVVLHDGDAVSIKQLPPPLNETLSDQEIKSLAHLAIPEPVNHANAIDNQISSPNAEDGIRPLCDLEREAIQKAIAHCGGNVLKAAVLLQISPSTLYRKKQAWETDEA